MPHLVVLQGWLLAQASAIAWQSGIREAGAIEKFSVLGPYFGGALRSTLRYSSAATRLHRARDGMGSTRRVETCCVLPTTAVLTLVIHCTKMRNSWRGDDPVGGSPCVSLATHVT